MQPVKSFESPKETAKALAKHIKEQVESSEKKFYLAISGGSTPKMLFNALANLKDEFQWNKLELYWVDERCVPPSHDDSNYKLCYDVLLSKVPLPEKNIHRIKGELSPGEALEDYSLEIEKLPSASAIPQFDLVILGLGDDGHTASIFPTEKELLYTDFNIAIGTNPYINQKRITLTGRTISNAKEIVFHVSGEEKAGIIKMILSPEENGKEYPASYFAMNSKTTWYSDNQALYLINV